MTRRFRVGDWPYHISYPDGYLHIQQLLASHAPFEETLTNEATEPLFTIHIDDNFRPMDSGTLITDFDGIVVKCGILQNSAGDYTLRISDPEDRHCAVAQASADFSCMHVALRGNYAMRQLGLSNALMMAYAFATADKGTLLVHASVVRRSGIGYLFLGVSGTGKSTHTANWQRFLDGCDLLNDDNPVLRFTDGQARVYGSPWSGKTPCYRQVQAPAGALVKLEQAPFNAIRPLSTIEAFTCMVASCSLMKWDRRIYSGICDTISALIAHTPCYLLQNLPDEAAVQLCHDTIAPHP